MARGAKKRRGGGKKEHEIIGDWVVHKLFWRPSVGGWQGRIRNRRHGEIRYLATRETEERKARQKVINWVRDLEREEAERKAGAVSSTARRFEDTFRDYLDAKKVDVRPVTRAMYDLDAGLYGRAFEGKLLDEIDLADMERFLAGLAKEGRSTRTRRKHLGALRGFFKWTVLHKYRGDDPTIGIDTPKKTRKAEWIALDFEQARKLLEACRGSNIVKTEGRYGKYKAEFHRPDWLFVAVLAGLHTGLRRRSIMELRWKHVDLAKGWITVPPELMKRGGTHRMPIHAELREVLDELLRGRRKVPLDERVVGAERTGTSGVLESVATRLGLVEADGNPIAWHCLRRSFATWYSSRVSYPALKKLLGHADEEVTDLYPKVPPAELEKAVREFPRILGGKVEAAARKA